MYSDAMPLRQSTLDSNTLRSYSTIPVTENIENINHHSVSRGWILTAFILISATTTFMGISSIILQLLVFLLQFEEFYESPLQALFLAYGIVLSICICMVELEVAIFLKHLSFLNSWAGRGLTYTFAGLLLWEELKGMLPSDSIISICIKVTSYSLITLGIIYAIMGAFYLKKLRDHRLAVYVQLVSNMEIQEAIREAKRSSLEQSIDDMAC